MLPVYRNRADREALAAAGDADGVPGRAVSVRAGTAERWFSTVTVRVNSVPQCLQPCVISSRSAANIVGLIEVTVIRPLQ